MALYVWLIELSQQQDEKVQERKATSGRNMTANRREPSNQPEINLDHCERLMQEYNPPNEP